MDTPDCIVFFFLVSSLPKYQTGAFEIVQPDLYKPNRRLHLLNQFLTLYVKTKISKVEEQFEIRLTSEESYS